MLMKPVYITLCSKVVMIPVLERVWASAMVHLILSVVATTLVICVWMTVARDANSMKTGSVFVLEAGESQTVQV